MRALGKNIDDGVPPRRSRERAASSAAARSNTPRSTTNPSPPRRTDNANKLVKRDKVDVLIGTVHSGVAAGMVKVARDNDTLLLIPNAGVDAATGALCAPNIFRTSFSNWQPGFAMGKVAARAAAQDARSTITWDYAAGEESIGGFKEGFEQGRRQGREGALPALPASRVPAAADRDRVAQARRASTPSSPAAAPSSSSRTMPRPACKETIPLVGAGLPHRRHARGAGRGGRRGW